jgi:hypothetical protein
MRHKESFNTCAVLALSLFICHKVKVHMPQSKEGVSKLEKSRSSEVLEFSHYYNDTLLSDTYAFD